LPKANSYAVLTYSLGSKGAYHHDEKGTEPGVRVWMPRWCEMCDTTPIRDPEICPKDFTQAGMTAGCTIGCNYRTRIYSSWKIEPDEYLPFALESRIRPNPVKCDELPCEPAAGRRLEGAPPEELMAPPAVERILISVSGQGNWWNNLSSAKDLFGLKFEWWTMNNGAQWANNHTPLATPAEPLMIGALFGRSLESLYDASKASDLPFVQRLKFNRTAPRTYEVVFINWEGQQHPWHIHGHQVHIVGQGWLDPAVKWRGKKGAAVFNASLFGPRGEALSESLGDFKAPALSLAQVDTFTSAPHSYVAFRITADNPGAWMMHCHMDWHLGAGMGMLWSVEQDGKYALPPPPDTFTVCNRGANYAAAKALHEHMQENVSVPTNCLALASVTPGRDLQALSSIAPRQLRGSSVSSRSQRCE